MKRLTLITISKKALIVSALALTAILALLSYCIPLLNPAGKFADPENGVIVIDPGHGGIDGGTSKDGILEKDINLAIAFKVRTILEQNGYTVLMTRENDRSLEDLDNSSRSRHARDLNARVNMINGSNAQLFICIHINSNFKKPSTNGAIVFYDDRFNENVLLAGSIQEKLNKVKTDGLERMAHTTVKAEQYYILKNAKIPGAIVETAFLSNPDERRLLLEDAYRDQLAEAICQGIIHYLADKNQAIQKSGF